MPRSSWESLRLDFIQLRAECAIDPPIATAGRLTAMWIAQPAPGQARWRLDYWNARDGLGVAERFKSRAKYAAARRGFNGSGDDAVYYWLDAIRGYAPKSHLRVVTRSHGPDGAEEVYSVELLDICGLSADYCWECEADEMGSSAAHTNAGDPILMDPFQEDASSRPLGDNPFPLDTAAWSAFEEATWKAKTTIAQFKVDFLRGNYPTKPEFIQGLLLFRKQWFTAAAFEATLIVGNEETAVWYEGWIDDRAKWLVDDTLAQLKIKDPNADPLAPPFFGPQELEFVEKDLTKELLQMISHYKGIAAARVVQVIVSRNAQASTASQQSERPLSPAVVGGVPAAGSKDTPSAAELAVGWRRARRDEARRTALDLAIAPRLAAEAELRKESADAVMRVWPSDRHQLEQLLWTPLSKYAEHVFDEIAKARLREVAVRFRVRHYVHWLNCTCLPAVLGDVCDPMAQFYGTADHILNVIGEADSSPHVSQARRAVAGILTEVLGGPRAESLETRLRACLSVRVTYWEAKAIEHRTAIDVAHRCELGEPITDPMRPEPQEGMRPLNERKGLARRWEEIEIIFTSDNRVQIKIGEFAETRNFNEFGFEDRRSGKPNRAWLALRLLGENNAIVGVAGPGQTWPKIEKRMQELRRALRRHFKLNGDPLPFVTGIGYKARFKIRCAQSVHY